MRVWSRMLVVAIAVLMPSLILIGQEEAEERRSLRELALELSDRLGASSVELRSSEGTAVPLDPVGRKRRAPAAVLSTAIDPEEVLSAMNVERTRRGLKPLRLDERLCRAAGDRVREMLEQEYFAHVAPDGREPFVPILERGYDFTAAGENLATGFVSARSVVTAWMRSDGHRENLLSATFEDVGVAVSSEAPTDEMRGHLFVVVYGAE